MNKYSLKLVVMLCVAALLAASCKKDKPAGELDPVIISFSPTEGRSNTEVII